MDVRTQEVGALEAALEVRAVLGRLRRRMREIAAGDALTPSQASLLARLAKGDHGVPSASALAALEGIRPQSMAALLTSLEQAGLVRRVPDPGDGRRSLVELTDAGRGFEQQSGPARAEWLSRALEEQVSADERRVLVDAMRILEKVLRP